MTKKLQIAKYMRGNLHIRRIIIGGVVLLYLIALAFAEDPMATLFVEKITPIRPLSPKCLMESDRILTLSSSAFHQQIQFD